MEDQLARAKVLIQAKQYDQARIILANLDHPTARKWLAKIDEMDDPFGRSSQSSTKLPSSSNISGRMRGFKTRQRIFWVLALLAAGWMCMGVIVTSSAVNEASEQSTAQTEDEQAAYNVGLGLGASVSLTVFSVVAFPYFYCLL